ncbi:Uricase OS=Streptomyces glaucescens OX=1907 GN=SGLAU_26725 PE=3 SV=1 [Streptomyces glaucescens]
MPTILGQNQYGKAENRVVKITRDGATHHIKDLTVSVALSGDMDDVHDSGSNANCLPTDTTKNTVYAFAKEHGIESAEQFGIDLARHFVTSQEPIHRGRIRIEEYAWERIDTSDASRKFIGADEVKHSFVRKGQETRLTQITFDGENWDISPV